MTDKLTTAEVRRAATTNLDLPLTLFKKLESGFDAWLESVKEEARAEGNAEGRAAESKAIDSRMNALSSKGSKEVLFTQPELKKVSRKASKKTPKIEQKVAPVVTRELTPEELEIRNKQRAKRGRRQFASVTVIAEGPGKGEIVAQSYKEKVNKS